MKLSSLRKQLNKAAGHGVNMSVMVVDDSGQDVLQIKWIRFVPERGAIVILVTQKEETVEEAPVQDVREGEVDAGQGTDVAVPPVPEEGE